MDTMPPWTTIVIGSLIAIGVVFALAYCLISWMLGTWRWWQ